MRPRTTTTWFLACATCFLLGHLSARREPSALLAQEPPKKVETPVFPMSARLGSNIYLHLSAEFRACCHQIYRLADQRLEHLLRYSEPRPLKPAVVMDLDETVLDNTAFQTFLFKNKLEYTDDLWAIYEEKHPQDVGLIAGAKDFIEKAERRGVAVIYISNRLAKYKHGTEKALQLLGINTANLEGRLFLKEEKSETNPFPSNKAARREAVAAQYNVLLFFGDNLRDFSDAFAAKVPKDGKPADYLKAHQERIASADKAVCRWGVDWFVLPNPVYGEWDKLIGPDPIALLPKTTMTPPAK